MHGFWFRRNDFGIPLAAVQDTLGFDRFDEFKVWHDSRRGLIVNNEETVTVQDLDRFLSGYPAFD